MVSGSISIQEGGTKLYPIDLNAKLVGSGEISVNFLASFNFLNIRNKQTQY